MDLDIHSSSDDTNDEFDIESDNDLQEAYSRGIIKPGLVKPPEVHERPKVFVNNVKALKRKLDEIKFTGPWIERLDLVNSLAPLAPELVEKMEEQRQATEKTAGQGTMLDSVSDDFQRELSFYRQAQAAVLEGIPRLQSMGIPTRRPEDYLAQMAKSDEHMQKVRDVLTKKKTEEERREKIRKFRQLKKFSKKVQAESRVAKASQKKAMLDEIKKYRKGQRKDLDFLDDDDTKKIAPKKKTKLNYNPQQGISQPKGKIKRSQVRRQAKDERYGQGGKKRNKKRNTRESASEVFGMTGGKKGGGKRGIGGRKGGGLRGAKNKQMRPGKSKRQKIKSKKR